VKILKNIFSNLCLKIFGEEHNARAKRENDRAKKFGNAMEQAFRLVFRGNFDSVRLVTEIRIL
jgi:hypothetical protein